MIELWIPVTIAAAFFQNLRSALQKYLKGRLSTAGAAYARFFYAWPLAALYLWGLHSLGGYAFPEPNLRFLVFCVLGGVSQILFTALLLWMFSYRNFAVGTTFSKLEVVMVAALGALILGDGLSATAVVAIALSAVGVVVLTAGQTGLALEALAAGLVEKPTLIGFASAGFLGASVVFFRGASLSLGHDEHVMAAAYALTVAVVIQTVIMGLYLLVREPGEIGRVLANWRWAGAVGVAGTLASVGWFTAFTLQNAAHVRALGQIELVFTFLASVFIFRESVNRLEAVGILLVIAAILLIVLAG